MTKKKKGYHYYSEGEIEMEKKLAPLFKGGQGRSDESVYNDGVSVAVVLTVILLLLIILLIISNYA